MIAMKYIISFIVISALCFINIGNCFAESASKNNLWSEYGIPAIIVVIIILIVFWRATMPSKKRKDNRREQEYTKPYNYDQIVVNQLVRNYLNSNEGKKLIEDFVRKDCSKIIEQTINEKFSEKKTVSSPLKARIQEQSQSVNTQTVNQGYAEKDSKEAAIHSTLAQQQEGALEQTAKSETHSGASNQLTIKYARETNNSFTLRDIRDSYQPGKSLYKLTIYNDNITARIEPILDREEVKQRALKDEGKLLEPICEIEKASDKPKDIKLINSGSAKLEDGNWVVDDKHKIRIKFE